MGVPVALFSRAEEVPPNSRVFMRLDQIRERRGDGKALAAALHQKGCDLIPSFQESIWYDDKVAQTLGPLAGYTPPTFITERRDKAIEWARARDRFPVVSKSRDGASGSTVRFIHNADDLVLEARQVFGKGIPAAYDRMQEGYVYWQDYVPCDGDYRWAVANGHWFGLRRWANEKGHASGSGINEPITRLEGHALTALNLSREIAEKIGTRWLAFDVIFDADRPYVTEISSAWVRTTHDPCPMWRWDGEWRATGLHGVDAFKLAVECFL